MHSGPKAQLRELNITAAKEIGVNGGQKAIMTFVLSPQLKSVLKKTSLVSTWKKVQWEAHCL